MNRSESPKPSEPQEYSEAPSQLSVACLQLFVDTFHPQSEVIYYPGSDVDMSIAHFFPSSRVIHVDPVIEAIENLKQHGLEAYADSANKFRLEVRADIVVLSNVRLKNERAILDLKLGGYVLANQYAGNARAIFKHPDFVSSGVISYTRTVRDKKVYVENAQLHSAEVASAFLSGNNSAVDSMIATQTHIDGDSLFIFKRMQDTNPSDAQLAEEDRLEDLAKKAEQEKTELEWAEMIKGYEGMNLEDLLNQ